MSSTEDWLRGQGRPSAFKLIDRDEDGRWFLQSDGVAKVREVTGPLSVVGIIGDSRKGKSYLMSRVAGHQDIFPLGHTYHACTHGVWAAIIPASSPSDPSVLLLDFEGFDSAQGTQEADSALWILALVSTSVLIYNLQSNISRSDLENLAIMVRLARDSKLMLDDQSAVSENSCFADVCQLFPRLVFCIRDAHLEGAPDSPEALRNFFSRLQSPKRRTGGAAASRAPAHGDPADESDIVVNILRGGWFNPEIMTIPHPGDALPRVEEKSFTSLPQGFQEGMNEAVRRVRRWAIDNPKKLWTRTSQLCDVCTGPAWMDYVEAAIHAVNTDSSFVVDSVVRNVSRRACATATAAAHTVYRDAMEASLSTGVLETHELWERHLVSLREALATFDRGALAPEAVTARLAFLGEIVRDPAGRPQDLGADATTAHPSAAGCGAGAGSRDYPTLHPECKLFFWTERNAAASESLCREVMKETLSKPAEARIAAKRYPNMAAFDRDLERMREEYHKKARGPARHAVLVAFESENHPLLRKQLADAFNLSAAQRSLAESERRAAQEAAERKKAETSAKEAAETAKRVQAASERELKRMQEESARNVADMQANHAKLVRELEERIKKEQQQAKGVIQELRNELEETKKSSRLSEEARAAKERELQEQIRNQQKTVTTLNDRLAQSVQSMEEQAQRAQALQQRVTELENRKGDSGLLSTIFGVVGTVALTALTAGLGAPLAATAVGAAGTTATFANAAKGSNDSK
eukprot:TRINITY_DN487_c0_g1_i1.p1 TRINITY_DN487_c0_g1~~TRINITY_DN487_c0_g1_i1.p1  ORF type:complete len:754 (+),score=144.30 TRINITY_DN487_c0_g1_i1:242-2503(+)